MAVKVCVCPLLIVKKSQNYGSPHKNCKRGTVKYSNGFKCHTAILSYFPFLLFIHPIFLILINFSEFILLPISATLVVWKKNTQSSTLWR